MERDRAVIARVAAIAAGHRSLDGLEWTTERLGGGLGEAVGISEGVHRFSGHGVAAGRDVPWSVIRKRLRSAAGHADPSDWDYWKREALAYEAGVLLDLADGFAAPVCFLVDEVDDDHIDIWLEDIRATESGPWRLERFGLAARHLGRFNGSYLAGRPIPTHPWLSPGRIRYWLAMGESGVANLDALAAQPIGSAWLTSGSVQRIRRQWRDRQALLTGLDALPHCLCHHDAFRRNLIAATETGGGDLTVAIDWAGVGIGAVGEDLAALVSISLQFLDVDAIDAPELDRIGFEGYVAGLRDAGAAIDERRVRFGYAAAASLLIGVGGACGWLDWLVQDEEHVRQAEEGIGFPLDTILHQWRHLQGFLLDLGDEAHRIGLTDLA